MGEWKMYMSHGEEFYRCAKGGYGKPKKFNEDALFNLLALSIEKLSMALLLKNSMMPQGHTFQELASSLNDVSPLPAELEREIVKLDIYQTSFCSLEIFRPDPITRKDIPPMLDTCNRLQNYIHENIGA